MVDCFPAMASNPSCKSTPMRSLFTRMARIRHSQCTQGAPKVPGKGSQALQQAPKGRQPLQQATKALQQETSLQQAPKWCQPLQQATEALQQYHTQIGNSDHGAVNNIGTTGPLEGGSASSSERAMPPGLVYRESQAIQQAPQWTKSRMPTTSYDLRCKMAAHAHKKTTHIHALHCSMIPCMYPNIYAKRP